MKTVSTKKEDALDARRWFVVDAQNQVLGRVSSLIANYLRGKHNVAYTPHTDTGDFIVVINAEKVVLTGKKNKTKVYHNHSGYVGGIKTITAAKQREKNPKKLIEHAVWGMMPKGPLGRAMYRKLKVYVGTQHPHAAQKPEALSF